MARCLTGLNAPGNNFRLISVDQQIAEFHKGKTRVPSLVLGINRSTGFGGPYWTATSWTAYGTPIAAEDRPDAVFDQLFRVDDPKARAAKDNKLQRNSSILDKVRGQARQLEKNLLVSQDQNHPGLVRLHHRFEMKSLGAAAAETKVLVPDSRKAPGRD